MTTETPRGMRKHIVLLGKTNSGKSTLFNLLTGQQTAVVSDIPGTTTDPVLKNIELLPFGPVTLIDTAGLGDTGELGKQRTDKTAEFARRADVGIILTDASQYNKSDGDIDNIGNIADFFKGEKIYAFSKCDIADRQMLEKIKGKYPDAVFISQDKANIEYLTKVIIEKLNALKYAEENNNSDTLVGDLLPAGSVVLMIVPIDSEAPKGRLILPQVQLIRDCLDHRIKAYVIRETEIKDALLELKKIDLAVTDSQVFALAAEMIPESIPLTSFSMLLARQKGNFAQLLDGTEHIKNLQDGDKILMLEACTHSHSHEDIGRVKIPTLLNRRTGKKLNYTFHSGYSMPTDTDELRQYSMAVLCGGCMINKAEVTARLKLLRENNIPATNYGVILAYLNGILERCSGVFE